MTALLDPHSAATQPRMVPRVASVCAPCHGLDGIGHDVEIPNIAGQHSIYLRNQLMTFKKRQRKHPEMRSIAMYRLRSSSEGGGKPSAALAQSSAFGVSKCG